MFKIFFLGKNMPIVNERLSRSGRCNICITSCAQCHELMNTPDTMEESHKYADGKSFHGFFCKQCKDKSLLYLTTGRHDVDARAIIFIRDKNNSIIYHEARDHTKESLLYLLDKLYCGQDASVVKIPDHLVKLYPAQPEVLKLQNQSDWQPVKQFYEYYWKVYIPSVCKVYLKMEEFDFFQPPEFVNPEESKKRLVHEISHLEFVLENKKRDLAKFAI